MSTTTTISPFSSTNADILGNLDPRNPLSIQALIDFHRTAFGGWTMNADGGGQGGGGQPSGAGGQGGNSGADGGGQGGGGQPSGAGGQGGNSGGDGTDGEEPLGERGMAALKSEREARKALQKQITDMQTAQQSQLEKLADAFGIKKPDAKSDNDEVVSALQKQMADLQHNNLVLTVAGDHKITDAEDLALLRESGSEESMRKLAKRLAAATTDDGKGGKGGSSRNPRPDRSQGAGNDTRKKPGEDGLAEARKRWPKPANQQ